MKLIVAIVTANSLVGSIRNIDLTARVADSALPWRKHKEANASDVDVRATPVANFLMPRAQRRQSDSLNVVIERSLKGRQGPGCQCLPSSTAWKTSARSVPKCIFIDLGAADGNTFKTFLANGFDNAPNNPATKCGQFSDYEAMLVEANPRFDAPLHALESAYPGKVQAVASTAAYMCEGQTTFYLDTQNSEVNYWGSSMSPNHPDAVKSGHTKVTVPSLNLMKFLTESTIPGDFVLMKMDIEGAEWDILPCLAKSPIAPRINILLVEKHPADWSVSKPTETEWSQAVTTLVNQGVQIPAYNSPTL